MTSWGERETAGVWETDPEPLVAKPTGEIFGYVYETIERGQRDGEHSYVGKTETTIHQRVHGPSGHTSPRSVAKDPWKANILPGKRGYRCLEVVRDTGEGYQANKRALARAEAFWIDRLRPLRNQVRPVRPPSNAPEPRPVAAERAPVRSPSGRKILLSVLICLFTALVAMLLSAAHAPWWGPWGVAPGAGLVVGWASFVRIVTAWERKRRKLRRLLR